MSMLTIVLTDVKQILEHVSTTKVISDENITDLVKQIALHSSVSCFSLYYIYIFIV